MLIFQYLKKPKVTGIVHKPVGVPYTFNYVDITEQTIKLEQ